MAYNNNYCNNNMSYYNRCTGCKPQMEMSKPACDENAMAEEAKREPVDKMPVGMCYVPFQKWEGVYEVEKGYQCGTIFPSLNKPFKGANC